MSIPRPHEWARLSVIVWSLLLLAAPAVAGESACGNEGSSCSSDTRCDDSDACNGAEVCNLPATAMCCTPDGNDCITIPVPQSECFPPFVWQGVGACGCGTPPCSETESCCELTPPVAGADAFACCATGYLCDPARGCVGCLTDADCEDDGTFCSAEACWEGYCVYFLNCDDGIYCTVDTCDELHRTCSNVVSDAICSDNNACNGMERCDLQNPDCHCCRPGDPNYDCFPAPENHECPADFSLNCFECVPGEPPDCDDGVDCTIDTCDPVDGCWNTPDFQFCNDDNFCNGFDRCDAYLGCIVLPACPPFPYYQGCFVLGFGCDEESGCIGQADDSLCDDGDPCNGIETCDVFRGRGTCIRSQPAPDCNDQLACTVDTCGADGCEHTAVECSDDGLACTANVCVESCPGCPATCEYPPMPGFCLIDGVCYADGERNPPQGCRVCDSATNPHGWTFLAVGSACDDDFADCLINGVCEEFGVCRVEPHHELCDDGIACTTDECTPIGCISTPQDIACDDGIDCTQSLCVPGVGCSHIPIHAVCGDGLFCNGAERCVVGVGCKSAPYTPCGSRPCDEQRDRCRGVPSPARPGPVSKSDSR